MVSLISYDMYGDNIPKGRWSLAPTLCKTVKRETKVISFVVFQLPWETFIGREVSSIRALSGMEKKMVRWHGLFAFVKWLFTFVTFLIWMLKKYIFDYFFEKQKLVHHMVSPIFFAIFLSFKQLKLTYYTLNVSWLLFF